jgi:NAD(P) transhydrogenase subunit alpha
MTKVVAESDVVITTAQVPGKKAPLLVTSAMLAGMAPGSVAVDLAAEQGGNCEPTRAGETVEHEGVSVLGPVNLPASVPYHASQMYGKNVTTLLEHLVEEGQLHLDPEDEITSGTLVARGSEVVHPVVKKLLGQADSGSAAQKES